MLRACTTFQVESMPIARMEATLPSRRVCQKIPESPRIPKQRSKLNSVQPASFRLIRLQPKNLMINGLQTSRIQPPRIGIWPRPPLTLQTLQILWQTHLGLRIKPISSSTEGRSSTILPRSHKLRLSSQNCYHGRTTARKPVPQRRMPTTPKQSIVLSPSRSHWKRPRKTSIQPTLQL